MVGFPNESTPKPREKGTALRQRFIDHLTLSGRARRTIEVYVGWVRRLAGFHRTPPDRLSEKQVREFLLDLHGNKRAFSTINQAVNALRSFYGGLLGWEELSLKGCLPRPGSAKKAPRAYSPKQVDSLLRAAKDYDILHYTFLSCLYHTGLRLNEGCYLRFSEVERSSQRILVKAGKGNKDRYTLLPKWLMADFDRYYHSHVVFTLPHQLNDLISQNAKRCLNLLFEAAGSTVMDFGRNNLGAQLGVSAVLHTWGQTLVRHYHLHLIVTGGGLSESGDEWIGPSAGKWLFSTRALGEVYRARYLEGLAAQRLLQDPSLRNALHA